MQQVSHPHSGSLPQIMYIKHVVSLHQQKNNAVSFTDWFHNKTNSGSVTSSLTKIKRNPLAQNYTKATYTKLNIKDRQTEQRVLIQRPNKGAK